MNETTIRRLDKTKNKEIQKRKNKIKNQKERKEKRNPISTINGAERA